MILDSHVHFWKYNKKRDAWINSDMKILRQHYYPEQLDINLKRNGVDGCIAVQASQEELETHFLMELSETHPSIKAVVGWVDLCSANVEQRLEYFFQYPVIKGMRHIVQAEPDGFLLRDDFKNGIKALKPFGFTYDILIHPRQLKETIEFVDLFPEQAFVLDHCGKPDIAHQKIADWEPLISELARRPNICCKLSGLLTEAKWKDWSPADFYPYLDVVFNAFGTDRLLFGSDWPVILVSGMYVQWKSLLEKYMNHFSMEEREKVFGRNAEIFYKLNMLDS